jgi:hypothetical protein
MDESDPPAAPTKQRSRRAANVEPSSSPNPGTSGATGSGPGIAEDGASLEAERVDVRMSAVGRVEADQVSVGNGAVGAVRADVLSVHRGMVGAAMADTVEVSQGYARSIMARQVSLDRAAAQVVVAADVQVRQSAAMILIARRVNGDLRVLLDWRGGLAFGAAAGLVFGIVSRLRRRR